jgi:hypothetical protein
MYNLKLDSEIVDGLVRTVLEDHRKMTKDSIKKLKAKKKLKDFEKEDLGSQTMLVENLDEVIKYFGG